MALEDAPRQGLQVQANDIIGRADPNIVTPQNTALLADSFRQGFITADDIKQRVGERAKAKEKLDITAMQQQTADLQDPELQDAARSIKIAQGATAKAQQKELSRREELAPLVQRAARAKTIWDIMNSEEFGEAERTKAVHEAAGVPIPKTHEGFIDFDQARKNTAEIRKWADSARQASAILQTVDKEKRKLKTADGVEVEGEVKFSPVLGRELSDAEVIQLNQRATQSFSDWKSRQPAPAVGQTAVGAAPAPSAATPELVTPRAAQAVPEVASVQANQNPENYLTGQLNALGLRPDEWTVAINTFRNAGSTRTAAEDVVRAWTVNTQGRAPVQAAVATAAPSAPAPAPGSFTVTAKATSPSEDFVTPRLGQTVPGIGRVQSVVEPTPKAPSEVQQRALNALARFTESEDLFQRVTERGYDPTSTYAYIEQVLPNVLRSGDRQAFDMATGAWNQGLLRLESGAAISRHEESWYGKTFFPQPGDSPEVVNEKTNLRKSVEQMVAQEAAAGGVSPELQKAAKAAYDRAEKINPAGGSTAPTGGQSAVVGGVRWTVKVGPDGKRQYFKQ